MKPQNTCTTAKIVYPYRYSLVICTSVMRRTSKTQKLKTIKNIPAQRKKLFFPQFLDTAYSTHSHNILQHCQRLAQVPCHLIATTRNSSNSNEYRSHCRDRSQSRLPHDRFTVDLWQMYSLSAYASVYRYMCVCVFAQIHINNTIHIHI